MARERVFIIEEPPFLNWLTGILERAGYEVRAAATGASGQATSTAWNPDAVVTGSTLPDIDGIQLVGLLKRQHPKAAVIVLSGDRNVSRAVATMKAGAYDYLEKPVETGCLLTKIDQGMKQSALVAENTQLKERLQERSHFHDVIGKSKRMQELFDLIKHVAPSDANVLIDGESGTGKELVATAIHARSARAGRALIKVQCAAIPSELVESELFGGVRGALTDATRGKTGLLELATGGSILLDDIAELSTDVQAKLLRALQDRECRPLGSDRVVPLDVRLICATKVDVRAAVREGRLRDDLYVRINTICLHVPPCGSAQRIFRSSAHTFSLDIAGSTQKEIRSVTPEVYRSLMRARWNGNVRELASVLERAVLLAKSRDLTLADLPATFSSQGTDAEFVIPPNHTLRDLERMAILQALEDARWNKKLAAQSLGVHRPTLYAKMKKHRIAHRSSAAAPPFPEANK